MTASQTPITVPLFIHHPRVPFSALAKPTGAACNLDCTYCFFLSKELLYQHDSQRMSEDTLARFVEDFLDSQPDGDVTFEWQGGEPTLRGLPFFERAVDLAEQCKRPAQTVHHSLQTNGTLIDDRWAQFLADNRFLVGLSMDGPAEYHDVYRVNRAHRGSHARVERAWHLLRGHGVETNILCTVHAANASHPLEVYRYFRDQLGARYLQFIPIVERSTRELLPLAQAGWHTVDEPRPLYRQEGDLVTDRSVAPVQWGEFLKAVWDEWVTRDVGEVYVQHFDTALGNALGRYSMCVHAPTCGTALAVLHNGDVYACDHYVEPGYHRGNLTGTSLRRVLSTPEQPRFGTDKATTLPSTCRVCPVLWACQGGCPKDRLLPDDGGARRRNHLCEGYYAFFAHITPDIRRMVRLIRRGRPPAAVMDRSGASH